MSCEHLIDVNDLTLSVRKVRAAPMQHVGWFVPALLHIGRGVLGSLRSAAFAERQYFSGIIMSSGTACLT